MKEERISLTDYKNYLLKKGGNEKIKEMLYPFIIGKSISINTTEEQRSFFSPALYQAHIIELLFQAGLSPNEDEDIWIEKQPSSLLSSVVKSSNFKIAEMFIKYKVQKELKAICYAVAHTDIHKNENAKKVLSTLMSDEININSQFKDTGNTPLHYLALFGMKTGLNSDVDVFIEKVKYLINKKGANPYIKNYDGFNFNELVIHKTETGVKEGWERFIMIRERVNEIIIEKEKKSLSRIMGEIKKESPKISRL